MESPDLSNEGNCYIAWKWGLPTCNSKTVVPKRKKYKWKKKVQRLSISDTKKATLSSGVWVGTFHSIWQDGLPTVAWAGEALQLPATWRKSAFLLPAFATPHPQRPGLMQLIHPGGFGQDTSNNPALLPTAQSGYHIPDCLFPHLCPSLPPILQVISACPCWVTFYCFEVPIEKSRQKQRVSVFQEDLQYRL